MLYYNLSVYTLIMAKLIAGLGNPGPEYENSRHNIGFMILDHLVAEAGGSFKGHGSLKGEVAEARMKNTKCYFIKPLDFMNNSGPIIKKLAGYYKVKPKDIVVIHDDLDIEFGKTKLSFGKGAAGHKGVESIIKSLKTEKFWRLRIGTQNLQLKKIKSANVSKPRRIKMITDFVISDFSLGEIKKIKDIKKAAAETLAAALKL